MHRFDGIRILAQVLAKAGIGADGFQRQNGAEVAQEAPPGSRPGQ